jgi:putative aldouronate transport system substrate-binding protein
MRRVNVILVLVLALVVLPGMVFAQPGTEGSKENVAITILGQLGGKPMTKATNNDAVMEEFSRRTGVTLDFTPTIQNLDFQAILPVMLASGDLPDIIMEGSVELRTKILTAKAAIPLDDLIKTNGKDLAKNAPLALKMSKLYRTDSTGALYFIPGAPAGGRSPLGFDKGLSVRWDLYKKLGYPAIKSLDDLLKLAEDMVKLEPTNPDGKKNYAFGYFGAETWGWIIPEQFVQLKGIACLGTGPIMVDNRTDTPIARITDEKNYFWQVIKMWNKAYLKGLVDPETPTMNWGSFAEKIGTGRCFMFGLPWDMGTNAYFAKLGTPDKGMMPIRVQIDEQYQIAWTTSKTGNHVEMCISKACKAPARAMDAINYLATFEGVNLLVNGVEGSSYDMVNGVPVVKQAILGNNEDYIDKAGYGRYTALARAEFVQDQKGNPISFANWPQAVEKSLTPIQKDMMAHYKLQAPSQLYDYIPHNTVEAGFLLGMRTPEPGSDLANSESKVVAYIQTAITRLIFQKSEAEYEAERTKVISDLKAMGIVQLEQFYTDQYKKMKADVTKMK